MLLLGSGVFTSQVRAASDACAKISPRRRRLLLCLSLFLRSASCGPGVAESFFEVSCLVPLPDAPMALQQRVYFSLEGSVSLGRFLWRRRVCRLLHLVSLDLGQAFLTGAHSI